MHYELSARSPVQPVLRICLLWLTVLLPLLNAGSASADIFLWDPKTTVLGRVETYTSKEDESLIEIARNFSVGFNAIAEANPLLDQFVPGTGALVTIPMQWIVPTVPAYKGIIVNLSEFRLYYFFRDGKGSLVATFPIGIGDEGKSTPKGRFTVIQKLQRPSWVPPPSVRAEDPTLPRIVPPGPENPLGSHALRLSLQSVLIHGTHRPFGVGRRVSHGCVRLYPEDIPLLYQMVPKGTSVTIIRQPVKIGRKQGRVYVEAHDDGDFKGDYMREAVGLLKKKKLYDRIDLDKLETALETRNGIPTDITADGEG